MTELGRIARELRGKIVELSHKAQTPHLASALSCVDILVAAYWGGSLDLRPEKAEDPSRDRLVFSKGHAATALYSCLAARDFFPRALLDTFAKPGSRLAEQPSPGCVPGMEVATGSLGHGLPIGVGMALGARIQGISNRVCVVMSDGECEEGSSWEAAMFAAAQGLKAVTAIIDYNKWQATGRSPEIMALDPLAAKWSAFGWNAVEVDGHDIVALASALGHAAAADRPTAIVAHTVKGKGVSFMEDDNNWHYRSPTAEELARARKELGLV